MAWMESTVALEVGGFNPLRFHLFKYFFQAGPYLALQILQTILLLLPLTFSLIALGCNRKYRQDVFQSPKLVSLPNGHISLSTSSFQPEMTPLPLLFRTDSLTWMDLLGSTTPTTEPVALPLLGVRRTRPTRNKPLRSKFQQSILPVL